MNDLRSSLLEAQGHHTPTGDDMEINSLRTMNAPAMPGALHGAGINAMAPDQD